MTASGEARRRTSRKVGNDLEPYRRLIEIQKQLAKMARQNEQTRRECEFLREKMAREIHEARGSQGKLRQRMQSIVRLLKRLPKMTSEFSIRSLNHKQASSC